MKRQVLVLSMTTIYNLLKLLVLMLMPLVLFLQLMQQRTLESYLVNV